jgi:hypothetical protein
VYKAEGGVDGGVRITGVRTDGERGNPKEVGLELVSRGDVGVVVDVGFERGYGQEGRGVVNKVVVGLVAQKGCEVSFCSGTPDVTVLVMDDVELVGVIRVLDLGTRRRSVGVRLERVVGCGRTILLVIKTCLFLCRQRRKSSGGIRGTWDTRAQRGFSGCGRGRRCRRTDVVRGGATAKGLRRWTFLANRVGGDETVRTGYAGWGGQ